MKSKTLSKLKRTVSGILALAMTASMATVLPASAEEGQLSKYPYAIFAADDQGGITLELDSFTLNGNGYTNGVFETTAQYPNINGTISVLDDSETDETITDGEDIDDSFDVSKDMIFIHNKLMNSWFTENCQTYDEDYSFSDMNINLNTPVYVIGRLCYDGNVSLNTAIGAVSDVTLTGGNLNGNNAVIYSKFGDIKITDSQASMNGLIYAPYGTVTIDCDNFNMDGIIIAQNVDINSYGANINYSDSWAEFVGTETEELSWTFDDWQYLADTDEDGLPNLIEKEIGTDQYDPDSDGDLLPDGYEVLTLGTDPMKPDTDDNGISDYDEDFDSDGLSNGQEYELGTKPYVEDTDGDNLLDGDEINTYFTNPLEVDTDEDGLNDDDEIYFGTDPNDPDSDDNGILDGKEKRFQTFIHKVENEDCVITEVRVSMEATGNLQKTTTVESVMNKDMLCTDVVGLVGEPFSIETTSEFDSATLTYVIDKDKLGDTEFDNLLFLWYNEAEDEFVELDTILDEENSTVSVETTHFSKYMLVDQKEWFEAWRTAPNYFENDEYIPYDTVITLDCSGSMRSYDPEFGYLLSDGIYRVVTYRQLVCEQYAASLAPGDRAAVVTFSSSAQKRTGLTEHSSDIQDAAHKYITNSGGTNYNDAIKTSIDLLLEESDDDHKKVIIFLSDGYPDSNNIDVTLIAKAVSKGIPIYTVGLGNSADAILEQIAKDTKGKFYKAKTAEELGEIYSDISYEQYLNTDWDDNDEDKIPDVFEEQGLICSNGRTYYTRYDSKETGQDTDGDELVDGDEIIIEYGKKHIPHVNSPYADFKSAVYFTYSSDPLVIDTDGDGYNDYEEMKVHNTLPNKSNITQVASLTRSEYINIMDENGNVWYGGKQSWFGNDKIKSLGCGLISSCDILIYLGLTHYNKYLFVPRITYNTDGTIRYNTYYDFVQYYYDNYLFILNSGDTKGTIVASALEQYMSDYGIDANVDWANLDNPWSYAEEGIAYIIPYLNQKYDINIGYLDADYNIELRSPISILNSIKEMLDEDIPCMLAIGPYCSDEVLLFDNPVDIISNKSSNSTKDHYVTVTAYYYDDIANDYYLEVSSWGKKYYISYNDFTDKKDIFSGETRICL